MKTGVFDENGVEMKTGDIVQNTYCGDLWVVARIGDEFKLLLIPNSGMIGHTDPRFPEHVEDVDGIDGIKIVGNLDEYVKMFWEKVNSNLEIIEEEIKL